jgi:hypothetical protein
MRLRALLVALVALPLGACTGVASDGSDESVDGLSQAVPGTRGGACGGQRDLACTDPTTACNRDPNVTGSAGTCTTKVFQRGQIVDGRTGKGIANAVVSTGATSTVSADDGTYALPVAQDTPYFMKVNAPGYWPFTDMAVKLHEDVERPLRLPSDGTWRLWDLEATFSFSPRDKKLGVLAVSAWSQGKCLAGTDPLVARADGVVFEVHGNADLRNAKVVYLTPGGGLFEWWNKSAQTGAIPHAIFYDLPTGVDLTVTMKNAPCRQLEYPVEWRKMTFTSGAIQTQPGNAWAFTRTWME